MIDYYGARYTNIPKDQIERFEYVNRKLKIAHEGDHDELRRGYNVVLRKEFRQYKDKWYTNLFRIAQGLT